jgi:hypothetical protein
MASWPTTKTRSAQRHNRATAQYVVGESCAVRRHVFAFMCVFCSCSVHRTAGGKRVVGVRTPLCFTLTSAVFLPCCVSLIFVPRLHPNLQVCGLGARTPDKHGSGASCLAVTTRARHESYPLRRRSSRTPTHEYCGCQLVDAEMNMGASPPWWKTPCLAMSCNMAS